MNAMNVCFPEMVTHCQECGHVWDYNDSIVECSKCGSPEFEDMTTSEYEEMIGGGIDADAN